MTNLKDLDTFMEYMKQRGYFIIWHKISYPKSQLEIIFKLYDEGILRREKRDNSTVYYMNYD